MNTSNEEREAIAELSVKTAFKAALSSIPVVGVILSDILFEYRGKVKQDRINKFVLVLHDAFTKANIPYDTNLLKSEELGDLFESILKKVALTRSSEKLISFKNILLKGMKAREFIDYCELFTEILSQLHEKQIEIVSAHFNTFDKNEATLSIRHTLDKELYKLSTDIELERNKDRGDGKALYETLKKKEDELKARSEYINNILNSNEHIRKESYYKISKSEYKFYIQDLYNKGLLYDEGVGTFDTSPFEVMQVTAFGKQFLDYIKEENNS